MTNQSINIFKKKTDVPQKFQIEKIEQREYLSDGELKIWDGDFCEVLSPICFQKDDGYFQESIGFYPLIDEKEAIKVLESSVNAYSNGRGAWAVMSVEERIVSVRKFVELMKTKRDEVVNLLMWEIGKNYSDACKEFDRTAQYIEDTIEALKELDRASSKFVFEEGIFAQIRRSPLGVVLCMGPYNYPLNETFATLIPALIMGNTVILKPAKYGVLLLRPLLAAFRDAFPKGVVNTIYGDGKVIIPPIMSSGKIDVFAFIGSANVANSIEKLHPRPNRLKSVLGLGAKNPCIILEDSDLDLAVKECVFGSLSFNGQRCTALKIIFIHQKIADEFLEKFVQSVNALSVGLPWEDHAFITPLPEYNKCQSMTDYVNDALTKGAKILNENGGNSFQTVFQPAVLYPVNSEMLIYHKEQFGPVVPIVPFDDISIPISYIEEANVGQQASIFGANSETIAKLIDPMVNQVSRVNINSQCQRGPDSFPFTGRKDSAEGTLSVKDALRVFSIRTLVAAKETDMNKEIFSKIVKSRNSKFLSTDFIL